jgi:DNA-binding transcriptional MerR regulator
VHQNIYLIKDLENLTGIKAHTIRIWELRHKLLKPLRTNTNIRQYSESDLKKILNINLLYSDGIKISKIARLSDTDIIDKATELIESKSGDTPVDVKILTDAILEMNSDKMRKILDDVYKEKGIVQLYQEVVVPVLVKIGELWQLNTLNIAHEHIFSNVLREFIITLSNGVSTSRIGKKIILFLPADEQHELPLLLYQFLLREKGWECIYLGQKVPFVDFEKSYHKFNPDMVITSMIKSISEKQFVTTLERFLSAVPHEKLCLSGSNTVTYFDKIPKTVSTIHSMNDFEEIFSK